MDSLASIPGIVLGWQIAAIAEGVVIVVLAGLLIWRWTKK